MNALGTRARRNRQLIARRFRVLLLVGAFITWLGVVLFSIGLVGYFATLRSLGGNEIRDSPLLVGLPVGLASILFGLGTIGLAAVGVACAWIAGRPGRRLLVAAVVAVVATGLVLTARALGANFGGLFTGWPNQSLGFAPRIQFSLAPLTVGLSRTNLGVNVGYETMSRATLWAWPVLMALPVSALWLPWAVFWPARTPANGRVAAPGSKEAPHDQWLERRLKRLFWTAAWCAAASAVLVVVWYLDYVGDYLLNPDAAAFFLSLGENVAGGFMTFSLGAMLAAAMGLIAARHRRPASARRSSCWHCAARCSPSCVTPSSADSRFDKARLRR